MADFHDEPGSGGRPANAVLRALPSVQRLLEIAEAEAADTWPRAALTDALRAELASRRASGIAGDPTRIVAAAMARLTAADRPALRRVINATGIVVHTNLGRAPLAAEALQAAYEVSAGACNLEFSLESGRRGERAGGVAAWLTKLTGAEAALAVNNNAAAMLLAMTAIAGRGVVGGGEVGCGEAGGGEVIVSRGELVEIGGGFRIPEVITAGGARLVEVGTTNKTRLADYEAAISPATRAILKVHQSNFRMVGFTSETSLAELSHLARAHHVPLVHDFGGGAVTRLPLQDEPIVADSIAAGCDLVAFSGDKLLGGPQAGLLVGRAPLIATLAKHKLMRALRLDKLVLAALEATLRLHASPAMAVDRIPVLRMLAQSEAVLDTRAARLRSLIGCSFTATIVASEGLAGGGAMPDRRIASRAIGLRPGAASADALARALRMGEPAVAARIQDGLVLLDMLTVADGELEALAAAVREAAVAPA